MFTIRFSKRIAKEKRNKKLDVLRELNMLQQIIDQKPDDEYTINKTKGVSNEYDKTLEQKTKGAMVRS